jgi:cytochrome c-type biogenesis protein
MADVTILLVFVAGILSFLSPCVLPLLPGFLGYLSGTSIDGDRKKLFLNSVAYVLGFASVFALLGVLLNTTLQGSSGAVQLWLGRIGGIIIIVFGLHLTGLLRIPWLQQERTIRVKKFSISYVTSFLFGASFAVGWSPCVGAVLGSVLALAATQPGTSFGLLLAYSLGLGVPFLIVGLFSSQALVYIQRYGKFLTYFNIIVGIFLIILGVLVFTQTLSLVANWSFVSRIVE